MMNKKLIIISLFILILTTMNQLYAQENDKTFAPSNRVKVESIRFKFRKFSLLVLICKYRIYGSSLPTC